MEPIVVQSAAACAVADRDLEALLHRAYVEGGFTDPDAAKSSFAAGFMRQPARDFQGPTGRPFLVFERPLGP
jgi:hypothetical protein